MANARTIVNQFFPKVTKINDADEALEIQVNKRDCNSARVRDHGECALAVAAKRIAHMDGAIVSISTAYLIKGDTATRYHLPASASREIVSFDRDAGFDAGTYVLNAPHKTVRLGAHRSHKGKKNAGPRTSTLKSKFRHHTEGIRTSLIGKASQDGIRRGQ